MIRDKGSAIAATPPHGRQPSFSRLRAILAAEDSALLFSKGRCDPGNLEDTLQHLVPFLAAAFRAPVRAHAKRPVRARKRRRS